MIYGLSVRVSEEFSFNSEVTLYLVSSQAPKSISLQRLEQKGKNLVSLNFFPDDTSIIFLQIGHLYFITRR